VYAQCHPNPSPVGVGKYVDQLSNAIKKGMPTKMIAVRPDGKELVNTANVITLSRKAAEHKRDRPSYPG